MHKLGLGCSAGPAQPQGAESILLLLLLTRLGRSRTQRWGREKRAGSTHHGKRRKVSGTGSSPGWMSSCQHFCELFLVRKNIRMGRPALVASSSSHERRGWQGLSSHHVTSSSARRAKGFANNPALKTRQNSASLQRHGAFSLSSPLLLNNR